jgi:large subunit ribosomal protein L35Ae
MVEAGFDSVFTFFYHFLPALRPDTATPRSFVLPPLVCSCLSRLYVKGVMMGFKRGLRNQYEHTSLLKIENVKEKSETAFYLGKRVCFIYKAQNEVRGSKFRTIWGRVTRAHGSRSVPRMPACRIQDMRVGEKLLVPVRRDVAACT